MASALHEARHAPRPHLAPEEEAQADTVSRSGAGSSGSGSSPAPARTRLLGTDWHAGIPRLLTIVDAVIILAAMFTAELIRFGTVAAPLPGSEWLNYTLLSIGLSVGWVLTLGIVASRDIRVFGVGTEEYKRVIKGALYFFGLVAIVSYAAGIETARGYVAVALPLGLAALLLGRFITRGWIARRRAQGHYRRKLLLVGGTRAVAHLHEVVTSEAGAGYEPVAAVLPGYKPKGRDYLPIPVETGDITVQDVTALADRLGAEAIALTGGHPFVPAEIRRLGWDLQDRHISLIMAPELVDIAGPRIHMQPLAGLPLIHVRTPRLSRGKAFTKRVFDILLAGVGLVLISPLLLLVALAVRLDSKGPILFRQERVGLRGEHFTMLKFRSMVADAEQIKQTLTSDGGGDNVLFKMKNDPRITTVGAFIRRTSIDELPQLLNVLRGDMSLVGPRPHLPHEVEQYEEHIHRRFMVQPGITGLWQVSGRSNLDWEDAVRLDLYYVENWSLLGDIVILGRTVRAVSAADGAY
ncbi:MAG: sugar transferase [Micrococcus sp.]|nr:sugar transferase [Micrococcus sp.]